MKKSYYCIISALILSSCGGSSIGRGNIVLFDAKPITNSAPVNTIKGIFAKPGDGHRVTNFEHLPVQNPGGSQFDSDGEFVKSYNLYKKRTQPEVIDLDKKTEKGEKVDEFAMYKLMGAQVVDTTDANWNVDYIPKPKDKSIGGRLIETINSNQSTGFFKGSRSLSEYSFFSRVKNFFTKSKNRIEEYLTSDGEEAAGNTDNGQAKSKKNQPGLFGPYKEPVSMKEGDQTVDKATKDEIKNGFSFFQPYTEEVSLEEKDQVEDEDRSRNIFDYYPNDEESDSGLDSYKVEQSDIKAGSATDMTVPPLKKKSLAAKKAE